MPENNTPLVIFAEDDNEDWILVEETLQECASFCCAERVRDGLELMERLRDAEKKTPDVILMDLKMPRKDGIEALAEIRSDKSLRHIPVIIMTTSKTESDVVQSYTTGANSYVVKPVTFEAMHKVLKDLHYYWGTVVKLPGMHD